MLEFEEEQDNSNAGLIKLTPLPENMSHYTMRTRFDLVESLKDNQDPKFLSIALRALDGIDKQLHSTRIADIEEKKASTSEDFVNHVTGIIKSMQESGSIAPLRQDGGRSEPLVVELPEVDNKLDHNEHLYSMDADSGKTNHEEFFKHMKETHPELFDESDDSSDLD